MSNEMPEERPKPEREPPYLSNGGLEKPSVSWKAISPKYYSHFVIGARIATLVALGLTIAGIFQSNKLVKISREVLEQASTRYIGRFPDNIDEITNLISRAEHDVLIMTDVAAYGHFSNHSHFQKYLRALDAKAEDSEVIVRVAVYSEKMWKSNIPSFFAGRDLEEDLKNAPRIEPYWKDLRYREGSGRYTFDSITNHCHLMQRLWEDELFYRKLVPGIDYQVPVPIPLRAWVIDHKEAIFSLQAVENIVDEKAAERFDPTDPACADLVVDPVQRIAGEVSFLTRDGSLVAAVLDLINNYAPMREVESEGVADEEK